MKVMSGMDRLVARMAAEVGQAPCDLACPKRAHCASTGEACAAFALYVSSGQSPPRLPREPSARWAQVCFTEIDAISAVRAGREMQAELEKATLAGAA
jgi:hypothetical protein